VADDDDVLNAEVLDSVGQDGSSRCFAGVLHSHSDGSVKMRAKTNDAIGDIAMDKDLAGLGAADGGFGDARVGAAEPEHLGLLGRGGRLDDLGHVRPFRPLLVVGQELLEDVHAAASLLGQLVQQRVGRVERTPMHHWGGMSGFLG
jgi:hypothetical protein